MKLDQTKDKLDEECQINSALQKNQVEWQGKFSLLEKEFSNYKADKDQVNKIFMFSIMLVLKMVEWYYLTLQIFFRLIIFK